MPDEGVSRPSFGNRSLELPFPCFSSYQCLRKLARCVPTYYIYVTNEAFLSKKWKKVEPPQCGCGKAGPVSRRNHRQISGHPRRCPQRRNAARGAYGVAPAAVQAARAIVQGRYEARTAEWPVWPRRRAPALYECSSPLGREPPRRSVIPLVAIRVPLFLQPTIPLAFRQRPISMSMLDCGRSGAGASVCSRVPRPMGGVSGIQVASLSSQAAR